MLKSKFLYTKLRYSINSNYILIIINNFTYMNILQEVLQEKIHQLGIPSHKAWNLKVDNG